jgi:7,8-dihydropterin-6-yl-methyl-4-(beta-D-ribofuranosyl)aminobenzene 5'-phosphate synthase
MPATPPRAETRSLTVLFDNNSFNPALITGWGFAAWLEYGGQTVLVDTGGDGRVLLDNLVALDLDAGAIDMVFLSHDHADHTGGLASLLAARAGPCAERGECITVYLPEAFPARFKAQARTAGATVVEVDDPMEILPGLWSTGQMGTDVVEQALVAETAQGLVVLTGCAHPGVERMVARAVEVRGGPVHLVVGGFHLGGASRGRVDEIAAEFRRLGVQKVAPCHCTGEAARELFREAFGTDFYPCGVGWQWQDEGQVWRPAGRGIPGQIGVAAVAVVPGDPRVVYLAAYGTGGLYRSTDGGDSWQARGRGLEGLAPLAVAVHPRDPDLAWVGTVLGGYLTVDGGHSWLPMAGLPSAPIYSLAVAPDGRTLFAGGEATGVGRSDDGGRTWQLSPSADGPRTILALAVMPNGGVLAGTAGQGLWNSPDGAQQWELVPGELAEAHVSLLAVADDERWYALAQGALYGSADGGLSWQRAGPPAFEALSFAAEPGPDGRLYLGSKGAGLAVSLDAGRSWELIASGLRHADLTCLAADPNSAGRVFLGTRYSGLYRTRDGGASWSLLTSAIGRPVIMALAQDPADPAVYYAGAVDGIYRSEDGGEGWWLVSGEMGTLTVHGLAVGPTGEQVYAATGSGMYVSRDGGKAWGWAEDDTGGVALFDVQVDPHDAGRIYAGSWGHNVLRSLDAGKTWAPIHNGLETLSVHAFGVHPSDPRRLYAGTVEDVYRSSDGGETWQATALAERPLTTLALLIQPATAAWMLAGTTDGVYLSLDGGQTWRPAGRKSLDATVTSLALVMEDARWPAILAGTEHHGLYRSADHGVSWQPWGLQATSVYAILVDGAGTVWLGTDQGVFRDR